MDRPVTTRLLLEKLSIQNSDSLTEDMELTHSKWKKMFMVERAGATYTAINRANLDSIIFILKKKHFLRERRIFPLHIAVEYENITSINCIIDNGVRLDLDNNKDGTALHLAIIRRDYFIAKYLITKGANIMKRNSKGENGLSLTAKHGDDSFIRFVFRNNRIAKGHPMINANYGEFGYTLLGYMLDNSHLRSGLTFKYVLKKGADVNAEPCKFPKFWESSNFLIQMASIGDNILTCRVLRIVTEMEMKGKLAHSCKLNAIDQNGDTLLHMLAARRAGKCIRTVLERGNINLNLINHAPKTPLNVALNTGDMTIIKDFINAGCDMEIKSLWCSTYPIDQAIHDCFYKAARLIQMAGFDVNKCHHKEEIRNGEVPGIVQEAGSKLILSLFCLAKKQIRADLIHTRGNVNFKILDTLPIPDTLKLEIYSLITDNGVRRRWKHQLRTGVGQVPASNRKRGL